MEVRKLISWVTHEVCRVRKMDYYADSGSYFRRDAGHEVVTECDSLEAAGGSTR